MKAYCWASGLIEFGSRTPPGAIQIASGREQDLRREIEVLARHGHGQNAGCLLVPGVPEVSGAESDPARRDALHKWLDLCVSRKARGVRWNWKKQPAGGRTQ